MPISNSTSFSGWKIHGNDYDNPEWKADGVVSYDGFGLMTFRGMLQAKDADDLYSLKGCPMFGVELGSAAKGFYVSKVTKKLQVNKSVIFDIEAIGIEPRCNGQTAISPAPSSSVSTEPIETHWNFPNIAGTPDAPLNGAVFDDKKKFLGFGVVSQSSSGPSDPSITSAESLAGVRSYYAPKSVFRGYFHCLASVYKVSDLNRLMSNPISNDGTISGIRLIPEWMGNAGDVGSWLLMSLNPEPVVVKENGEPVVIKVSYELLRARTKWNPLIYISGAS